MGMLLSDIELDQVTVSANKVSNEGGTGIHGHIN